MSLISLNSLSVSFGERLLFEPFNLEIFDGEKIGLIGANGAGKTTLFKLITGELEADSGGIVRQKGLRIGYMEQIVAANGKQSAYEAALSVFSHLIEMENRLDALTQALSSGSDEVILRYNDLRESFEREGGLTYKSRTRSALIGLGLNEEQLLLPIEALSGGQLSKISLARLLLSDADLMLLDEPTNHLDIPSVEWLESFLKSSRSALIVISHDRYFLDSLTNRTVEIEHCRVKSFKGSYTEYTEFKKTQREIAQRHYDNTMAEIERLEAVVEQQHQWNREKNIKTADSKQKEIDRLRATLIKPESELESIRFTLRPKLSSGSETVVAEHIAAAYGDNILYSDVCFKIRRGEKVFLLGENGCGKTTLLKQLIKQGGGVRFGPSVSVSYFDQTQSDLDGSCTALEEMQNRFPLKTEGELRNALAAFLFKADDVFKKVASLSGGERARLAILKIMLDGSNFLLLDEPTNHLDLYSRQALENALSEYGGTMLIVSHDRRFIDRLADRIFVMEKGGITQYEGNYSYYLQKRENDAPVETVKKTMGAGGQGYKDRKKLQSDIRKLRTAVLSAEKAAEALEAELNQIEILLSDVAVASDYTRVAELTERSAAINAELERVLGQWEASSEQLAELEEM